MVKNRTKFTSEEDQVEFHRSIPELDECRFLIKKVIEQAVRDYAALEHAETLSDQQDYESACGFLFDDDYRIEWGGQLMSLQDLLDWVDLDQGWVRRRARLAKENKLAKQEAKRREQDGK